MEVAAQHERFSAPEAADPPRPSSRSRVSRLVPDENGLSRPARPTITIGDAKNATELELRLDVLSHLAVQQEAAGPEMTAGRTTGVATSGAATSSSAPTATSRLGASFVSSSCPGSCAAVAEALEWSDKYCSADASEWIAMVSDLVAPGLELIAGCESTDAAERKREVREALLTVKVSIFRNTQARREIDLRWGSPGSTSASHDLDANLWLEPASSPRRARVAGLVDVARTYTVMLVRYAHRTLAPRVVGGACSAVDACAALSRAAAWLRGTAVFPSACQEPTVLRGCGAVALDVLIAECYRALFLEPPRTRARSHSREVLLGGKARLSALTALPTAAHGPLGALGPLPFPVVRAALLLAAPDPPALAEAALVNRASRVLVDPVLSWLRELRRRRV